MAKVLVITGPSGVGKGTLIQGLLERVDDLELSVSATTRAPRDSELPGRDYHFMDPEQFAALADEGAFLEHAAYSGNRYGTLRSDVEHRLALGKSVVLEIEVQGARQIRERLGSDAVPIFIAPPTPEALRERLQDRGTDRPAAIRRRLETAREELDAQREFRYVVVNDRLEPALDELEQIARRELAPPRPTTLPDP